MATLHKTLAAAAFVAIGCASGAQAFTCTTPSRTFTVDPASACEYGMGNINGNETQDAFLLSLAGAGFEEIADSSDNNPGILTAVAGSLGAGLGGTIGIDFSKIIGSYTSFALGLKSGGNQTQQYVWGVFDIEKTLDGLYAWTISGRNALSHVMLYGIPDETPAVPLPAGLPLVLTGLGALGFMAHRRSKA